LNLAQVAKELGVNQGMVSRWRCKFTNRDQKAFKGQVKPNDKELLSLKWELARVKKERNLLREAATYFANESK